jgi:tRNA(Ile)-lysidine synthase
MARIPPAVAAVRVAVRRELGDLPAGSTVLVACSGGADSLALATATAFVAPRLGLRAGLVTVDHGLQDGSAERAAKVAAWAREAGFEPVEVATVQVAGLPGGPEAAARTARYAALSAAAERHAAAAVLLGHTRDDQAETVLLALARGAGPRGLSGMPQRRKHFRRPLLTLSRADTRAACAGLAVWADPHNSDRSYSRARVRIELLPAMAEALGDRVVDNLARTASQIADDNNYLDRVAADELARVRTPAGLRISDLSGLARAIRRRVLHAWARELGAAGAALSHRHVEAMDALVTDWHGQGPASLPGGLRVVRRGGELTCESGHPESS